MNVLCLGLLIASGPVTPPGTALPPLLYVDWEGNVTLFEKGRVRASCKGPGVHEMSQLAWDGKRFTVSLADQGVVEGALGNPPSARPIPGRGLGKSLGVRLPTTWCETSIDRASTVRIHVRSTKRVIEIKDVDRLIQSDRGAIAISGLTLYRIQTDGGLRKTDARKGRRWFVGDGLQAWTAQSSAERQGKFSAYTLLRREDREPPIRVKGEIIPIWANNRSMVGIEITKGHFGEKLAIFDLWQGSRKTLEDAVTNAVCLQYPVYQRSKYTPE